MPLLKGQNLAGFIAINRNVRFQKAVDFNNAWQNTLYADYDDGSDSYDGKSSGLAFKNPATALTAASAEDVIYLRPRSPELGTGGAGPYYGGDPGDITPATAVNWVIPYLKYGLQLIGCGTHKTQTCLQGHASVTASPVLDIRAPYCNIENLAFKPGGSTAGIIKTLFSDDTVYQAWANTFFKLWLRNAPAAGGLILGASSYDLVEDVTFSTNANGIVINCSNAVPYGIEVRNCYFEALAASVYADIATSGAIARFLATGCYFNHAVPAAGSPARYISIASASTGLVSDCYCGASNATIATHFTLNGIHNAHIWGEGGEVT